MQRPEGEPSVNALPQALEDIGIEDKAGAEIPRDVKLVHSDGTPFTVGDYLDGQKPLVVVLAYYRCPMLCSLVLNGMNNGLKAVKDKSAGKDFRVLVVSFDARDTTDVAREKRDNYAKAYGREVDRAGFEFATGDAAEVKRLADALGFRYRWDDKTQQFAHAAGLFFVTPGGKLSQVLTGIQFKGEEVDVALDEASKGGWHSPLRSALLYCFTYDPKSGSYVPIVRNLMKVGGAVTVAIVGALLLVMFRRERARVAAGEGSAAHATYPGAELPGAELPGAGLPGAELPGAEDAATQEDSSDDQSAQDVNSAPNNVRNPTSAGAPSGPHR
jgi:protein SCO1/2